MREIRQAEKILENEGFFQLLKESSNFGKRKIFSLPYEIKKLIYKYRCQNYIEGENLYPNKNYDINWKFHDENWERVVDRWEHRDLLDRGRSLTVFDDTQDLNDRITWIDQKNLHINVPPGKDDRWVYLYLDPRIHSWKNYRWKFQIIRGSGFKELQFGFRYRDFYNRYRFRHQNDLFHYDIVRNGQFENSIKYKHFPMDIGEQYDIEIIVLDNRFLLKIDGEKILDEIDIYNRFPRGSCAIILWEENNQTPIQASFKNMTITELY